MSQVKLVVAEKPSVARSIATVLGATQRKDNYIEGNGYIVSWCVGHLVQMVPPDAYDPRYAKWRREDLPIIPEQWQYAIVESTKKQFATLKRLMNDTRVSSIVCATDAGREGELIFRLVYEMCGCRKIVERLWISSLEESAIRQGFHDLKPGSAYDALYQAALCRAKADWLVGMNGSRLLSTEFNQKLSVGRVMTPTLSMIAARAEAIASFVPTTFYTVELDYGSFAATSERYSNAGEAAAIADLCNRRNSVVQRIERTEKRENPPRLFDLTSLQREANRLHGFTAQQTLDYTQNLYEKKLCTYPRTDSQFLPSGMQENVSAVMDAAASILSFAQQLPSAHSIAQILNDKKISDHHAIIPTIGIRGYALESLPSGEQTILMLILARLFCAVGAPHEYAETTLHITCADIDFTTKGKQVIREGWRTIAALFHPDDKPEESKEHALPMMKENETLRPASAAVKQGKTTPPKPYTEGILLSAMERAGGNDAPEGQNQLGTPATRAATIEKLVNAGFVERKGGKKVKHLQPTQKGIALIAVAPQEIRSPLLTAEWEERLKQIEDGELSPDAFLSEITGMLSALVRNYEQPEGTDALFPSAHKPIGVCLRCGGNIIEKPQGFFCEDDACGLAFWKNNYFFATQNKEVTADFVRGVLKEGRVLMRGLRSQKSNHTYDAYLVFDPASDKNARFKIELVKK